MEESFPNIRDIIIGVIGILPIDKVNLFGIASSANSIIKKYEMSKQYGWYYTVNNIKKLSHERADENQNIKTNKSRKGNPMISRQTYLNKAGFVPRKYIEKTRNNITNNVCSEKNCLLYDNITYSPTDFFSKLKDEVIFSKHSPYDFRLAGIYQCLLSKDSNFIIDICNVYIKYTKDNIEFYNIKAITLEKLSMRNCIKCYKQAIKRLPPKATCASSRRSYLSVNMLSSYATREARSLPLFFDIVHFNYGLYLFKNELFNKAIKVFRHLLKFTLVPGAQFYLALALLNSSSTIEEPISLVTNELAIDNTKEEVAHLLIMLLIFNQEYDRCKLLLKI